MNTKQMIEHLESIETLCREARRQINSGSPDWVTVDDVLYDANRDLEKVMDAVADKVKP